MSESGWRDRNSDQGLWYEQVARLIAARQPHLDMAPLRAVADARLVGKHVSVAPFIE